MASPSISLHQSNLSFSSPSVPLPPLAFPSRSASYLLFVNRNGGICRISLKLGSSSQPQSAVSSASTTTSVTVENGSSNNGGDSTAFVIRARNLIGLLQVITRVFQVLGLRLDMAKVEVKAEGDSFAETFFDSHGNKIEDGESLERIQGALIDAIDGDDGSADSTGSVGIARLGVRNLQGLINNNRKHRRNESM